VLTVKAGVVVRLNALTAAAARTGTEAGNGVVTAGVPRFASTHVAVAERASVVGDAGAVHPDHVRLGVAPTFPTGKVGGVAQLVPARDAAVTLAAAPPVFPSVKVTENV
jgi:hypothetical protein